MRSDLVLALPLPPDAPASARPRHVPVEEALAAERPRLVRLCARLAGGGLGPEGAEDLAQETLYEAWRHRERLAAARSWRSYLNGIAHHVCLRWRRRHSRGGGSRPDAGGAQPVVLGPISPVSLASLSLGPSALPFVEPDTLAGGVGADLDAALERGEVAALLDGAMALLPAEARTLLYEEYVEELPQAEIAARRGWTENNAAVRLHRCRAALKKALAETPALRSTAAAYGLLDAETLAGWAETRLWCPNCGLCRLEARFERGSGRCPEVAQRPETGGEEAGAFAVRCARCRHNLGYDFTTRHAAIDPLRLLGEVKGAKPALNRLSEWWGRLGEGAVARREVPCATCGAPDARVQFGDPPAGAHPALRDMSGMYMACGRCRKVHCLTPNGFAFHSAVGREFWKRNPRMRLAPWRTTRFEGREAVVVRMESAGADAANLEMVLARDTYETLHVEGDA